MTITPDELRAIRERAEAATDLTDVHNTITCESVVRTDVPALCDEVERLRGSLERIRTEFAVRAIIEICDEALDGGERKWPRR